MIFAIDKGVIKLKLKFNLNIVLKKYTLFIQN